MRRARTVARTAPPREGVIQREVMLALGALPGVIVYRNTVGVAEYTDTESGETRKYTYGLGPGTPDVLVFDHGHVLGLEVKRPGEDATPQQAIVHAQWRAAGTFACVVRSAADALAALDRARNGELQ